MTDDEEVVGCSEWMRAENADFLLIVEMRNQLPDLIAYIDRQAAQIAELEKRNADLEARLGHEQVVTMQNRGARLQGYIRDLGAQVAALKEIAVEGWAVAEFGGEQEGQDYHLYFREWNIDRESYRKEARELLQAEHPEVFR